MKLYHCNDLLRVPVLFLHIPLYSLFYASLRSSIFIQVIDIIMIGPNWSGLLLPCWYLVRRTKHEDDRYFATRGTIRHMESTPGYNTGFRKRWSNLTYETLGTNNFCKVSKTFLHKKPTNKYAMLVNTPLFSPSWFADWHTYLGGPTTCPYTYLHHHLLLADSNKKGWC